MRRADTIAAITLAVALSWACGEDKGAEIQSNHPAATPLTEPAPSGDPVDIFMDGVRAFNESNLEDLLRTLTPDTVWHVPCAPKPPARGRKAVARQLAGFKGMLPDARITVRRVISAGDLLAAQCLINASIKWDGQGIKKDRPGEVGYEVLYFVKSVDGPAQATLLYFDRAAARRQLGHMTGDAPPVPKPAEGEAEVVKGGGDPKDAEVVRGVFATLSAGDPEALRPSLAEGFSFTDMSTGEVGGFELLARLDAEERQTLPSSTYTLRETVGAGRYVAVHWAKKGMRAGDGKQAVTLHGAHVFELQDGKIAAMQAYTSKMELIEQLGMVDRFRRATDEALPPVPAPDAGR